MLENITRSFLARNPLWFLSTFTETLPVPTCLLWNPLIMKIHLSKVKQAFPDNHQVLKALVFAAPEAHGTCVFHSSSAHMGPNLKLHRGSGRARPGRCVPLSTASNRSGGRWRGSTNVSSRKWWRSVLTFCVFRNSQVNVSDSNGTLHCTKWDTFWPPSLALVSRKFAKTP